MLFALKLRIKPTEEQRALFDLFMDGARFVYNISLKHREIHWSLGKEISMLELFQDILKGVKHEIPPHKENPIAKDDRKRVSNFDQSRQFTVLLNYLREKPEIDSEHMQRIAFALQMMPKPAIENVLANLQDAYFGFMKGKRRFPRYKKRDSNVSFFVRLEHFKDAISFENGYMRIPKVGNIAVGFQNYYQSDIQDVQIKNATISRSASGKYYASVLCDNGKPEPEKKPVELERAVGVFLANNSFLSFSDGIKFNLPLPMIRYQALLARKQRELSRRVRYEVNQPDGSIKVLNAVEMNRAGIPTHGKRRAREQSTGYKKTKLHISKIHEKIRNIRVSFLHKISAFLVKNYDTVCIESFDIQKLATGSEFAKYILDCGFGEFRSQIEYKARWNGVNVFKVDRKFMSTHVCSRCNHVKQEIDRFKFSCENCGFEADADVNAANVVLKFGIFDIPEQTAEELQKLEYRDMIAQSLKKKRRAKKK